MKTDESGELRVRKLEVGDGVGVVAIQDARPQVPGRVGEHLPMGQERSKWE